ncbi:HNH/endonuclease VII fold putative polymorphic toxin [Bdellovibrionota bacterium FG-2]
MKFISRVKSSIAALLVLVTWNIAVLPPTYAGTCLPKVLGELKSKQAAEKTFESRNAAFRQAKNDAKIPMLQQPFQIRKTPLTDRSGKAIIGIDGRPILTREYLYQQESGKIIVIQEHSLGHQFGEGGKGDQKAHFNIRPIEDTRNGEVKGTLPHYSYE